MKGRWFLMDRDGRKMIGFRTRWAARRWLADVGDSNPPAVGGWVVVRAKDARPVIGE